MIGSDFWYDFILNIWFKFRSYDVRYYSMSVGGIHWHQQSNLSLSKKNKKIMPLCKIHHYNLFPVFKYKILPKIWIKQKYSQSTAWLQYFRHAHINIFYSPNLWSNKISRKDGLNSESWFVSKSQILIIYIYILWIHQTVSWRFNKNDYYDSCC